MKRQSRRFWLITLALVATLAIVGVVLLARDGNDSRPDVHHTPSGAGGGGAY